MRNVNRWKPKGSPPPESILLHSSSCEHLSCRGMRKSPLSLLLLLPLMLLHDDNLNETEGDNGSHYHHTHRYCRDEHLELLWAHLTPARSVHPGLLLSHWHSSHFSLWSTSHSALENLTSCCSLSTSSIRKPAHSERQRNGVTFPEVSLLSAGVLPICFHEWAFCIPSGKLFICKRRLKCLFCPQILEG